MAGTETCITQAISTIAGLWIFTQQRKKTIITGATGFTRHGQSSRTRDSFAIHMQALRRSDEAHCVQLPETDLSCHSNKYRHSQTGRKSKLSQTDMTYPRLP